MDSLFKEQSSLVIEFLQKTCKEKMLRHQLKSPYPANRESFEKVAKHWGYDITGHDIDDVVRFYQFYPEFQKAIARHEAREESLIDWLEKWFRHIHQVDNDPLDDERDTIKRYLKPR